jgi:hypothetical protein
MKIKDITKRIVIVGIISVMLVSCSEDTMDNINKDLNHTTQVDSRFTITDVMTSTAFSNIGGDINTYVSIYVEHEVGTHNQFYRAEMRTGEPANSSTFNNVWGGMYTTLKDAKGVIERCSAGGPEESNSVTKGVAEVLLAYNLALLTDIYGDVPWTEACDYTITKTPKIDKQEAIYKEVMAYIEAAIVDLQKTDAVGLGNQDFIYRGNKTNWLKAAYGLKARYTMRLIQRSSNVQADMQTVLDCVSKSFASAGEQCAFAAYGGSNINPMYGTFYARFGLGASKSLFDRLVAYDDPRVNRCFMDPGPEVAFSSPDDLVDGKSIKLAPNGNCDEGQLVYSNSVFVAGEFAPTYLLSYHEILFLKAEALYHLGRIDEAKAALKAAVVAGMANTEANITQVQAAAHWGVEFNNDPITSQETETYFDTKQAPLFDADPLKTIMIQKYIAFWGCNGESVECYNDVRRMKALGHDFYELKNPNRFPLRAPYGGDDTTTNPNVQAAYGDGQYVYSENVWWAGGSR